MLQESEDLLHEVEALSRLLTTLEPDDWNRPTAFLDWTPWDVVAHLHQTDLVALAALRGEEAFAAERDAFNQNAKRGGTQQQMARDRFGEISPMELIDRWQETCREMAEQLGASDPERRLPWFGPDMGVRMFTTARYMETWAHGQEVFDLVGVRREYDDRIKNIVAIGLRTFGWTFVNRGEDVPEPRPFLRLEAPSGEIWTYGDESNDECVKGSATDFCHVVTQGRNITDTHLEVKGPIATRWMSIAQCFAGAPVDPPAAGTRTGA